MAASDPTVSPDGRTLPARRTLVIRDGRVERGFSPLFPPGGNARVVARWPAGHPI